ncbi:DUF6412 domain-containing protein [Actinoplanes sp. NPDC051494]|uniref:DUF6412 domain-containing protein n=1 Tax=Actinoplanes sp. NPDC051494 TaxID=3363907 RepID=UPI00378FBF65
MLWSAAFWHLVGLLTGANSADLFLGTGAVGAVLLMAVLAAATLTGRRTTATEAVVPGAGLHARAARTRVPRHRDPDAAGRTRPRGPTGALAAA